MKYNVGQSVQVQGEEGKIYALTQNPQHGYNEYLITFKADNDDIDFYAVYREEQIRSNEEIIL